MRNWILSIVDGAHAPGQININLEEVGADIYTGACHKWMMSPKGASFLYARKEVQSLLDPLVISWGYDSEEGFGSGNRFIDYHEWQGTRDPSPFLSVPAAINFMRLNRWDEIRKSCYELVIEARREIDALTGLAPICPEKGDWLGQMISVRLPKVDPDWLKDSLYNKYKIEIPIVRWQDQTMIRISIQGYNTSGDIDRLVAALGGLLRG